MHGSNADGICFLDSQSTNRHFSISATRSEQLSHGMAGGDGRGEAERGGHEENPVRVRRLL